MGTTLFFKLDGDFRLFGYRNLIQHFDVDGDFFVVFHYNVVGHQFAFVVVQKLGRIGQIGWFYPLDADVFVATQGEQQGVRYRFGVDLRLSNVSIFEEDLGGTRQQAVTAIVGDFGQKEDPRIQFRHRMVLVNGFHLFLFVAHRLGFGARNDGLWRGNFKLFSAGAFFGLFLNFFIGHFAHITKASGRFGHIPSAFSLYLGEVIGIGSSSSQSIIQIGLVTGHVIIDALWGQNGAIVVTQGPGRG